VGELIKSTHVSGAVGRVHGLRLGDAPGLVQQLVPIGAGKQALSEGADVPESLGVAGRGAGILLR